MHIKTRSILAIIATLSVSFILSVGIADAKPRKHYKKIRADITQTYASNDERYPVYHPVYQPKHVSINDKGRPAGCPHAWCGCFLSIHIFGENRRELWKAFNWKNRFPKTAPKIGAVAVMARKGGGHVGQVVGFDDKGNPILLSGNHSGKVATSVYPKNRILAYVQP